MYVFRPLGVASLGSIPYMLFEFIAFLIILKFLSLKLVLDDNYDIKEKGNYMKKTKTLKVVIDSILETSWAIGVGSIVGQLAT